MQRTYLVLVALGLLACSAYAIPDQTGARLDPDCACQIGFEVNCTDPYPLLRSWELITSRKCNETGDDGKHPKCAINKSCSLWFYVLNAYRYGCPPNIWPTELARDFPYYQASSNGFTCYNCFQPRWYSSYYTACPKYDCSKKEPVEREWAFLKANCSGSGKEACMSPGCRTSYSFVKTHLDACAPTSMPRDAVFGLYAFDANCWAYGRCNFHNASLSIANYDYNCSTRNNLQGSLYSYLSGTNSQFNITGNSASSAAAGLSVVFAMVLALLQLLL